jgi:hypothetical protein
MVLVLILAAISNPSVVATLLWFVPAREQARHVVTPDFRRPRGIHQVEVVKLFSLPSKVDQPRFAETQGINQNFGLAQPCFGSMLHRSKSRCHRILVA